MHRIAVIGEKDSVYGFATLGLEIFRDNRQLFLFAMFSDIARLRDMDSNFAVLTIPKYDESQKEYLTRTFNTYLTSVIKNNFGQRVYGYILDSYCLAADSSIL